KLFHFNPPSLQRSESLTPPVPLAPWHFLDRHISESLILKRLKIVPSFHVDLTSVLKSIETADALSIIRIREKGVEYATTQIASSLILHPDQPDMSRLLKWLDAGLAIRPTLVNGEYASQNLTLHVWDLSPDESRAMNRQNREMHTRLYAHTDQLASCMIFCTDGLSVMQDMARLDAIDIFPWRLDSHYSGASSAQTPPPDAPDPLWILPTTDGPRRSRRVRIRYPNVEKTDEYVPQCEDYIQKAWVAAVKIDASLILFDCGNFVRIGIRHRELQTLFLSDLIDICSCKDPSYGELWTALHIAVASDAVQRALQLENPRLGKRKQTSAQRIEMAKHLASFPALAVFFRFSYFDSPAPLFSSTGSDAGPLPAKGYLSIIADKPSGQVLWATYIVLLSNPPLDHSHRPFILKVASKEGSIRRLKHELRVYRHLHDAGVAGIPSVLGFRENPDGELCVLMLSDAGLPLARRMDSNRKVELTPVAQESLRSILGSIHEAGILHRDVRSWNILEDASGRVRFTDFDRASFCAKEEDYVVEKARLEKFIGGEYVDEARVIGADDLAYAQRR
ncbi:hypothetical protein CPB85DRAFT_1322794, partial [Mucidula mucida]